MPTSDPHQSGRDLAYLFGRFEHALKRSNFLKDNKPNAEANWDKFARELGGEFYEHVRSSKVAETLIDHPPRKLMSDGLVWRPVNPAPLTDVVQLIVQGVCRVRNSLIHGEKFVGSPDQWERDAILVTEALAVLHEAKEWVPAVAEQLARVGAVKSGRGD